MPRVRRFLDATRTRSKDRPSRDDLPRGSASFQSPSELEVMTHCGGSVFLIRYCLTHSCSGLGEPHRSRPPSCRKLLEPVERRGYRYGVIGNGYQDWVFIVPETADSEESGS